MEVTASGETTKDKEILPVVINADGEEEYSGDEDDNEWSEITGSEEDEAEEEAAHMIYRLEHRTIDDENLPDTVSLLKRPDGAKVYLIGTAHFSEKSCEEVKTLVQQTQPDVVVLELCRNRAGMLTMDEKILEERAKKPAWNNAQQYIKEKGLMSGLLTMVMMQMSAHITKELGCAPGGEFRAAFKEARVIPGCQIILGDREIGVTLKRAFARLSTWEKIKMCYQMCKELGPISQEDVEKLKEKDFLEQALAEMMKTNPELVSVFCSERDISLTHSIQQACKGAVQNPENVAVVAVVGIGHRQGIIDHFDTEISTQQIKEISTIPKKSKSSWVISTTIKLSVLSVVAYGLFKLGKFGLSFAL